MELPPGVEARLEDIRKEIENQGAELVEISYRRQGRQGVLTILVDKPGGVTLEECVRVNKCLSEYFDEMPDEFFQGSYYLEVNSPGLDRPLKTRRDFERAMGETVRILYQENTGAQVSRTGTVIAVKEEIVELRFLKENAFVLVPLASVIKAVREIKVQ